MDNCIKLGLVAVTASAAIVYCWWKNPTKKSLSVAPISSTGIGVAETVAGITSVQQPTPAGAENVAVPVVTTVELPPAIAEVFHPSVAPVLLPDSANKDVELSPLTGEQPPSGHLCCECLYFFLWKKYYSKIQGIPARA